ncbi:hypothetical protein R1sor_003862 [Riccia sorocarpa]|uniref:Uncharacterized protein n=1 Tax=Riccia sorocarpa TaxID=122646 RepID=A0ABD3H680_9MARC
MFKIDEFLLEAFEDQLDEDVRYEVDDDEDGNREDRNEKDRDKEDRDEEVGDEEIDDAYVEQCQLRDHRQQYTEDRLSSREFRELHVAFFELIMSKLHHLLVVVLVLVAVQQ